VRLFVALETPLAVRENLVALRELCGGAPGARWVRAENLHVTLKFIGEMPETKLDALRKELQGVRSESPVALDFRGLGFFPNEKHPRVFWAGMEASANLNTLAADIDNATEKLGIPREQRAFSPHLTLARFESPKLAEKLRSAAAAYAERNFGSLRTNTFQLIQSKLKPTGAEYTTLASFRFAASEE